METVRRIEELSLNALPALEHIYYDGWELRFSNGYPRRANSIQMLYPSLLPLEEKITFCQAQYDARGLITVFKLTPASPDGLGAALRARGYVEDAVTSVQMLDLSGYQSSVESTTEVLIERQMTDSWFTEFAHLNENNPVRAATTRIVLERLAVESAFIRLRLDGETVALGRAALDQGWVAPYEIATDPRFRQRGYGFQLMQSILRWGIENGAHSAYLQVMVHNTPAVRLYSKLGFREQYRYWYLQNRLD